jgi:tetratricopeptide (TPR) repeat protein
VEALRNQIKSLSREHAYADLLLVSEKWKNYLPSFRTETQLLLAQAYQRLGFYRMAFEIYSQYASNAESRFQAAKLAWLCHEYETAERLCRSLQTPGGNDYTDDATLLLACVCYELKRFEEAEELLDESPQAKDPEILLAAGKTAVTLGRTEQGIQLFRNCIASSSQAGVPSYELLVAFAKACYQHRDFKEAVRYFRMQSLHGDNRISAEPLEILCLFKLEQEEEALGLSKDLKVGSDKALIDKIVLADLLLQTVEVYEDAF